MRPAAQNGTGLADTSRRISCWRFSRGWWSGDANVVIHNVGLNVQTKAGFVGRCQRTMRGGPRAILIALAIAMVGKAKFTSITVPGWRISDPRNVTDLESAA